MLLNSVCLMGVLDKKGGIIITIEFFSFYDMWLGEEIYFMLSIPVNCFMFVEVSFFLFQLEYTVFSIMVV